MKIILTTLFLFPFLFFSQNFSISDFLSLDENADNGKRIIKDAERIMHSTNGLRMIDKYSHYDYYVLKNCNVGNIGKINDDGYNWQCTNINNYRDKNGNMNSFLFKQSIPHTNYRENEYIISEFAKNYNKTTERASTFVDIKYYKQIENNNYKNIFEIKEQYFKISFQFLNKSEFYYLKRGILDIADYDNTPSSYYGDYPPVIYIFKNNERIISFTITEGDDIGEIDITYKCSDCK